MMFVYHYLIIPFHPQYLPRHAPSNIAKWRERRWRESWPETIKFSLLVNMLFTLYMFALVSKYWDLWLGNCCKLLQRYFCSKWICWIFQHFPDFVEHSKYTFLYSLVQLWNLSLHLLKEQLVQCKFLLSFCVIFAKAMLILNFWNWGFLSRYHLFFLSFHFSL